MRLKHIYRYPVKSMGGAEHPQIYLGAAGIPGDRCWAVKDETRGSLKGGKRFAEFMNMQARLEREPSDELPSPAAHITLSDGTTFLTTDPDANDKLSASVGTPLSLWPLLPASQLEHYLREAPEPGADMLASLREMFGRNEDEPLPDLSQFPPELMQYESPPGTYFDAFSLLLVTESSLNALREHGDSNFDVRRFRPNLVIEDTEPGFAENDWVGKQVRLGDATLAIEMRCPRCVMTTHGFADVPKDPQVMRTLVQANGGDLGVYATVIDPGTVHVGDALQLL